MREPLYWFCNHRADHVGSMNRKLSSCMRCRANVQTMRTQHPTPKLDLSSFAKNKNKKSGLFLTPKRPMIGKCPKANASLYIGTVVMYKHCFSACDSIVQTACGARSPQSPQTAFFRKKIEPCQSSPYPNARSVEPGPLVPGAWCPSVALSSRA